MASLKLYSKEIVVILPLAEPNNLLPDSASGLERLQFLSRLEAWIHGMANSLFLIGFEKFERENDFPLLTSSSNNFKILSDVLCGGDRPVVSPDNVWDHRIDRSASDIRDDLKRYFEQANPGDILFVYLTGHGVISNKANDLVIPTGSARLHDIKERNFVDPSTCLSFKAEIANVRTKASSVNVILDCCHAGAGEAFIKTGVTAKDAAARKFDDAVGLIENISDDGANSTKFTYLLASDADGSAYDVKLDIKGWEAGIYAKRLREIGVDENKKVSRLVLALMQLSESPKIIQLPPSEMDKTESGNWTELLESVKRARDVNMLLEENDDGLVSLLEVGKGLASILSNSEPPQQLKIIDDAKISEDVPIFYKPSPTYLEMLGEIDEYSQRTQVHLTEASKRKLGAFLLDASDSPRPTRSEPETELVEVLHEAVESGDTAKFVETFILRHYEAKLRSEVRAAVRRRMVKSDQIGERLTHKLDARESELKKLSIELDDKKTQLKNSDDKLKFWRPAAIILTALSIIGVLLYIYGVSMGLINQTFELWN